MSRRTDISSVLIIGAGVALIVGCSRQPPVSPPPETRAERLAVLDRIAAHCQVPRTMMTLIGEEDLRLNPPADLAYERMECVLRRIDQLNLPPSPLGYVGNRSGTSAPGADNAVATDNAAAPEASNALAD